MGTTARLAPRLTHCAFFSLLGRRFSFLIGRNGHDGSSSASPDPLLLASDSFSLAHRIQDTTAHRQLQHYKLMVQ